MISRGLGSYIYLSLSPDETKIAFVKVFGGKFYLGVMKANGSGETLLKEGYIIEAPSWTPTGTNVIASFQLDKSGTRRIYSVSTVTGYAYPLKISQGNIVQANWLVDSNDYIHKNSN
jgi:TolB protein